MRRHEVGMRRHAVVMRWHAVGMWWACGGHVVVHAGSPSSLMEARHTPPMTGMRQSHLAWEIDLPYRVVPTMAAKAGSDALTIWAKETAPRFIEKIEARCAPAAHAATGKTCSEKKNGVCGCCARGPRPAAAAPLLDQGKNTPVGRAAL